MIRIPLSQGLEAIVDDADADLVCPFKWSAFVCGRTAYAVRRIKVEKRWTTQRMHVMLTGWRLTDHINGNGADNRRANLRQATTTQNMRNMRKRSVSTSQFKGVQWHKAARKWMATITVAGRSVYLGLHVDEAAAARAYDAAARQHFGQFAAVNFPLPGERSALDQTIHAVLARLAKPRVIA
jgi:hypothetical protein